MAPSAGVARPRLPCQRPGSDGIPAGAIALLLVLLLALLMPRRESTRAAAYAALLDRLMPAVLYWWELPSRVWAFWEAINCDRRWREVVWDQAKRCSSLMAHASIGERADTAPASRLAHQLQRSPLTPRVSAGEIASRR